jgi:hypothetical protein
MEVCVTRRRDDWFGYGWFSYGNLPRRLACLDESWLDPIGALIKMSN